MSKDQKSRPYTIGKVRRAAEGANQYFITIERDGKVVGDVRVMSSSTSAGYFSDDQTNRPVKKNKVA